jgi:hypothetical protein
LTSIVAPPELIVTARPEMSVLIELAAYLSVPPLNVSGATVEVVEPMEALVPITSVPAFRAVVPV